MENVPLDLVKRSPKIEATTLDLEFDFTDHRGHMLGSCTRCAWAELDQGPAQSVGSWTTFRSTSIDQRIIMLSNKGQKDNVFYNTSHLL